MKCPGCGKQLWFNLRQCPYCRQPLPALQRPPRPWWVSLACLGFFALGLLTLAALCLTDFAPGAAAWRQEFRFRAPAHFYLRYAMPLSMMLLALFMLRGHNWARWVFVVWFGNNLFWQTLNQPRLALPSVLLFLAGALLLFLPRSRPFFQPAPARTEPIAAAGPPPTPKPS